MRVDLDHKKANFRECMTLILIEEILKTKVKRNNEIYKDYDNPKEIDSNIFPEFENYLIKKKNLSKLKFWRDLC